MNGGLRISPLMRMWLTCLPSVWVVQSDGSLFGWFCIMYSLRKRIKLAVHGRRLTYVLASHKDGNCLPFDTHVVRFYSSSWNASWLSVSIDPSGAVGFCYSFFFVFLLAGDDWSIQCGILSDCRPALVWGECFSTVLLEVKHTGTSRACVSDLVPQIYHNLYKLVLDTWLLLRLYIRWNP